MMIGGAARLAYRTVASGTIRSENPASARIPLSLAARPAEFSLVRGLRQSSGRPQGSGSWSTAQDGHNEVGIVGERAQIP